ncbi:helix-turn-helix transcriptional regulator [Vibrio natriegens]|uniref:helix-turn-helix transcriptional regulator n=1 Tax=Vibrio natriegens TaxID=691 RepID=UPI002E311550|nr:helix-turn-helix transcriptional regulator [Vibrio natriegens]
MKPEDLSRIIDKIYAASLNSHSWEEVSLEIQKSIGGHSVNFVIEELDLNKFRYVFSNGATESDVAFYLDHIVQDDELTALLEKLPIGKAFLSQNFLPLRQLERVSAYDRFYRHIGQTYFNAANFYRYQNVRAFISIARSHRDIPFSPSDQQNLQLVIPHLSRALMINNTLENQQITIDALGSSFEHLPFAFLTLDEHGNVIICNIRARQFITSLKQLRSNYLIRLPSSNATQRLHMLIDSTLHGSNSVRRGSVTFLYKGERYVAHCFPWCERFNHINWLDNRTRCIIFITSAAYLSGSHLHWQEAFGFSQAESNIANGLICGKSAKDLAEQLFVSESTVRFHVKNILKKTETKSQIAAVSLMLRSLMIALR